MRQSIDFSELARRVLGKGLTTKELGLRIGLSQPSASRLATGKTKSLAADAALRLIELAGGSVAVPPAEASTLAQSTQPEASNAA